MSIGGLFWPLVFALLAGAIVLIAPPAVLPRTSSGHRSKGILALAFAVGLLVFGSSFSVCN